MPGWKCKSAQHPERQDCLSVRSAGTRRSSPPPYIANATEPACDGKILRRHGLFTHPVDNGGAHVAYVLGKNYQTLSGAAAISDSPGGSSATPLTFRIVGDGKELWRATMQKAGSPQGLKLSVDGVSKLELFVDCPGNAHAAHATWVDLELTRADAAPPSKSKKFDGKVATQSFRQAAGHGRRWRHRRQAGPVELP